MRPKERKEVPTDRIEETTPLGSGVPVTPVIAKEALSDQPKFVNDPAPAIR